MLHAFTSFYSVGSFRGKTKSLSLLLKAPAHCDALEHLGDDWNIDDLLIGSEKFTCALYGKSKLESINEMWDLMIKPQCDGEISIDSLRSVPLT